MNLKELLGKTIIKAEYRQLCDGEGEPYDDIPYLDLWFDDGTKITIVSYYGDWDNEGYSEGEYPRYLEILEKEE